MKKNEHTKRTPIEDKLRRGQTNERNGLVSIITATAMTFIVEGLFYPFGAVEYKLQNVKIWIFYLYDEAFYT